MKSIKKGGPAGSKSKQALSTAAPDAGSNSQKASKKKGSWLSRAWSGVKDFGADVADTARDFGSTVTGSSKDGALMGLGLGALVGGGVSGALAGAAHMPEGALGKARVGLAGLGGALAGGIPGALLGGLAGVGAAAKDALTYDEEQLLAQTADIPGYHVILEQLAHQYAYGAGDLGTLERWGYELSMAHEDTNSGFRVVGFKPSSDSARDPDGKPLRPVVAFRGTSNAGGAMDDLNDQGVGTFQFSRNEREILQVIQSAKGAAPPDVTGHSLGGALAQLAAARFGSMIGNIVTFQAAGINGAEAQRIDADMHQATHYRTGGDLVHSGGEAFALGDVIQFDRKGLDTALSHMTYPLAQLNALRGKNDTDAPVVEGVRSEADEWVSDANADVQVPNSMASEASHQWSREGGADFHKGHWKHAEGQTESRLHSMKRHEANNAPQSGIVELLGGKSSALAIADKAASMTNLASRQQAYARAWRDIRAVAMSIQQPSDTAKVRAMVVDLVIQHKVEPRDHAKFISQAEAAMLDALEGKGRAA